MTIQKAKFSSLFSWVSKGSFAILDQGLVSGSNFALNIFLARWLTPAEYGSYAIVFSIFLLLSGFHNALILEPMSVIGPSRYNEQIPGYLGAMVRMHGVLTFGLAFLLALGAIVMSVKWGSLTASLLAVAIAMPFILLFWLLRRACYLKMKPEMALKGSVIYSLSLFLGLLGIWRRGWISGFSVFLIMGLSSAFASLIFWRILGIRVRDSSFTNADSDLNVVLGQHWGYGKWILGATFTGWSSSAFYSPLVGAFAGLEATGAFRVMENLFLPLGQTLTALGLLLLPWASRQMANRGYLGLRRASVNISLMMTGLAIVYGVIVILLGRWAVLFLYGKDYYMGFLWLLPYIAAIFFIGAVSRGMGIALRAAGHPDSALWSTLGGAAVTLTLGIFLVWQWKLQGAVLARMATVTVTTSIYLIRWVLIIWRQPSTVKAK